MTLSLTIAEAATATGLTAYTLRYYEQIGLIDPVPRRGGQRIYGEAQMRTIQFVLRLRATGMPMRDIQEYSRLRRLGETPESISARGDLLERHAQHMRDELASLTETIARLDEKIALYRSMYGETIATPTPRRKQA
ncbi:MerR family transcriptional regulator [Luteibacter yeojuensis]|uniref:MerR family transcriptional regulator n=1 Tax=Luteibacter yeojuensis TaxID=345309 RepID=A0A0F3KQ04_9GAMM|nr:MerR family transcriptional regulator [Luteibacter yeojuensis]KJV33355.1 MerR family transcriptional regulator [Luteibacter yeojuensis]